MDNKNLVAAIMTAVESYIDLEDERVSNENQPEQDSKKIKWQKWHNDYTVLKVDPFRYDRVQMKRRNCELTNRSSNFAGQRRY